MELKNIIATDVEGNVTQMPNRVVHLDVRRRGDVNNDSNVDIGDLNSLITMIAESTELTDDNITADVSADGFIDITDVNYLINILLQ